MSDEPTQLTPFKMFKEQGVIVQNNLTGEIIEPHMLLDFSVDTRPAKAARVAEPTLFDQDGNPTPEALPDAGPLLEELQAIEAEATSGPDQDPTDLDAEVSTDDEPKELLEDPFKGI